MYKKVPVLHSLQRRALPFALIFLTGCGSQIDNVGTPTVRATSITPGGIYAGQITTEATGVATPVMALITDGEKGVNDIIYFADDSSVLASGLYTAVNSGFTAQLRSFELTGPASTPLTLDVSGTYEAQTQVIGSYTRQDGAAGSLNLAYVAADYELPSATAKLAGVWVVTDAYGALQTSFDLDGTGDVSGQDIPTNCSYNGNIALVDQRYNIYSITLAKTCGSSPVTLIGLVTLLPANSSTATLQPQTLVLALASVNSAVLFQLHPGS